MYLLVFRMWYRYVGTLNSLQFQKIFSIVFPLPQKVETKVVSEYDQKMPQSQTAEKPVAPWGRATQQSRDTRQTNKTNEPALSFPSRLSQTRMDTK